MNDYETRVTEIMVLPKGDKIFSYEGTTIKIVDEAAGEFLKITQYNEDQQHYEFFIDPTEWKTLRAAIDKMIKQCRKEQP